ncbi:MAG: Rha family transcriptional regulator [Pseudomonadota bacterium]
MNLVTPAAEPAVAPAVELVNGHLMVRSLTVAEHFRRSHFNVLRDIRNLDCSEEFRRLNFQKSTYLNKQGREQPMIHLTRDGFIFLVMGYTGREVAQMKERLIPFFDQEVFGMTRDPEAAAAGCDQPREREMVFPQRALVRLRGWLLRVVGLRPPEPAPTRGDVPPGGAQ